MKTRYTIRLAAAGLTLMLLAACNDQLDLPGDGRIPRDQIFANRDNVRGYLDGAYDKSVSLTVLESNFTDECEESIHGENDERYMRWYSGSVTSTNFESNCKDDGGAPWSKLYQGIRRCNVFLEGIKNYDGLAYGEDGNEVNAWKAQALTLRALYYMQLIKRYGGVPCFTEELDTEHDASGDAKSSFSQVAVRIIDDCRAALDTPDYGDQYSFSWNIYQNQNKIMHRGVAYAVMAEAALFAASPLYSDGTVTWNDAMKICGEALHQCLEHDYKLFDIQPSATLAQNPYAYYFLINPFDQRVTDKETILVNGAGIPMWKSAGLPSIYGQLSAGPCPVQELIDCYEMKGTGEIPVLGYSDDEHKTPLVNPAATDYKPDDPYVGRDPRFYASIYYNGAARELGAAKPTLVETFVGGKEGLLVGNRKYTSTGYYMRKFSYWGADGTKQSGDGTPRTYRLGWLYLNFAEAAYQATGDPYQQVVIGEGRGMSAVDAVNAIRRRSDMPDLPAGLTVEEFEKRYRNERRVELAFEGHRYYDVRRWKILDRTEPVVSGMEITKDGANLTYKRFTVGNRKTGEDRFLFYPIGEKEIQKIIANTGGSRADWQNAGW